MPNFVNNWKIKVLVLLLALLPSFTTFFINYFNISLFEKADISIWYIIYIFISFFIIWLLSGSKVLQIGLVTAATLSISVVFAGGLISYVRSGFSSDAILLYSDHYLIVLLNTLAIVPITIAFVSSIPIREYENNLLQEFNGISGFEKRLLIATRIFNHIVYTVLPKIIFIKREENNAHEMSFEDFVEDTILRKLGNSLFLLNKKMLEYINLLLTLLVESIEFIPLWAVEINELPTKKSFKNERKKESK